MKKLFGVFSLAMLLFSTFAPNFTYATGEAEIQAQELLSNTLVDSMRTFEDTHGVANFQQSEEDINLFGNPNENNNVNAENEENDEIEIVGNNNHILWNKTKGYITVYSGDYSNGITISDRNLGADNVFDTGDYYKWGTGVTISDPYDLNDYINDENAWSGENAQGPCSGGYHVPEISEYKNIMKLYFDSKNLGEFLTKNNGNYSCSNSGYINQFINDLKIPKSGWLNSVGVIINSFTFLYSSTFSKPNNVKGLFISNNNTYMSISNNALFGSTVRCFKNNYIPYSLKVKFNPNGGAFSGMNKNEIKEYTYETNENGIAPIYNIQIPDRESENISQQSGWMFAGWYTKSGDNDDWGEEFDISNPQSTTAYAKWLPFNDLDLNVIGLPGVMIMDRNMGAENIAIGIHKNDNNDQSEDNEKLGLYYQWGNNYGFKNIESSIKIGNDLISNTKNTIKPRGPNNYFYNNLFVGVTTSPYRWNLEENFNLWGGENNRNSDLDKKGPCPQGYHIPDIQEWNAIYNKLQTNQSTICEGNTSELWKCFAEKLKLPFAGALNSNNGNIVGKGNYGNYWSANPYSIDYSYHISFGTYTNIQDHSSNASGKPIRCFKNNVYFNKLKLNIGNDEENKTFKLRRWETIGAYLSNIEKKGFELLGWYDDNLYINETDTKNTINSDKSIFAKREKNPRYTFNGNGGKFNDGKEEIEIKYLIKREEYNKSTNSSYGSFRIEGAKALNVTLNKTDDYGTYHEVCIYNHNKTDTTQGEDCIIRGKAGEINNVHINGDTVGFVIRQNGPQIAAEFNIVADNGYETDDNVGEPSNSGYTFSGWYETGATDPFDFTGTEVTKDRTFYAKWNPHHYTIQFDINEGTGTAEDINATYGEEITLPTISKEGYTFKGWKSEDGIIYNNIIPEGTGVTTEEGVTVTLTAQWELIPAITPSAGGGQSITPAKQETKVTEQEHNSADNEDQKVINTQTDTPTSNTVATEEIKQQVKKVEDKSLTRGEVAIMTNILLEVYPQLVEGKQELDDVTNACSNYADEQNFTKDEKKAITILCKLSIMGIHNDTNEPLNEFLVNSKSTNDEFSKVINRSIETYNEKDLSTIKDALKKLEGDEENVVFGTVYEVFMSIKNIFN